MNLTDEDLYYIGRHLADNMETYFENYLSAKSPLPLQDYIQAWTATDLNGKYTSFQIREAFQDHKIKTLMEFFLTEEDYGKKNSIH